MSDDPGRWLDQADLDPDVRRAVEAGQEEAPSDAQLASLAARLGPLLGPGGGPGGDGGGGAEGHGGGGGGAGGTAATGGGVSLAAKAMGGLMAAVAITGVGLFMAVPDRPQSPVHEVAPPADEASPEPVADAPPPLPEGVDAPEPEPAPAVRPTPSPRPPRETDPAAELALIRQAQSALASAPREALAHTVSHERRFGEGALAQEREVVAIDALVRLERLPQARARAARFRARWPRSAHVRRIDVLVPPE